MDRLEEKLRRQRRRNLAAKHSKGLKGGQHKTGKDYNRKNRKKDFNLNDEEL